MKPSGRVLALAVLLCVAAAGCTSRSGGGGRTPATLTPSEATGATGGSGPPSYSGPPGTALYEYVNGGLTATMHLDGDAGTLEIRNGTGRELPAPAFYILDARDGHRIAGTVKDAVAVPNGQASTFDVSFAGIELNNIGLLVLLMGHDNYGAFVRR